MPTPLCLFHVKRAWDAKLITDFKEPINCRTEDGQRAQRNELKNDLDAVMFAKTMELATQAMEAFRRKWPLQAPKFVPYMEKNWAPRLGARARATRHAPPFTRAQGVPHPPPGGAASPPP